MLHYQNSEVIEEHLRPNQKKYQIYIIIIKVTLRANVQSGSSFHMSNNK